MFNFCVFCIIGLNKGSFLYFPLLILSYPSFRPFVVNDSQAKRNYHCFLELPVGPHLRWLHRASAVS